MVADYLAVVFIVIITIVTSVPLGRYIFCVFTGSTDVARSSAAADRAARPPRDRCRCQPSNRIGEPIRGHC